MLGRGVKYLLIVLLLTLSACSSTTFVYNRLDFLLPWYLDDYVDLNRSQKKHLDELLQPYLHWHRTEELSRYIDILDQMETVLNDTVQPGDIEKLSVELEAAWSRLEEEGLKWLLVMGDQLSDQQIVDFLQQLNKTQTEYEREYLERDDQEYFEDSYDNFLDTFQDYLGKLDSDQKSTLKAASLGMQRVDSAWLEERARWLIELETILQREPGWQLRIREALDAREEKRSPEYRLGYQHNLSQVKNAMVLVLNSRTEKQDRRLRGEIANFRQDLQTLIDQASP